MEDPDFRALFEAGFAPGQTTGAYWRLLWKLVFSPTFHARFFAARYRDNFTNPDTRNYRRALAKAFYALVLALLIAALFMGGGAVVLALLAAWFLSIGWLGQVNSTWQLISEHWWLRVADSTEGRVILARKTRGRFLSPALPNPRLFAPIRLMAWFLWLLKVLLVTLPLERLFTLPLRPQ